MITFHFASACETAKHTATAAQFSSILVNFCELLLYSFWVSSLSSSFAPWRFPHFSFTLCLLWTRNEWMKKWKLNMRKIRFSACFSPARLHCASSLPTAGVCSAIICSEEKLPTILKEEKKRRRRLRGNREEQKQSKTNDDEALALSSRAKKLNFLYFFFSRAFLFHECCHINFQQRAQSKREGRSNEAAKVH